MTFEILVSTMHKSRSQILEMLEKMNVHCDCVIVNQCNENRKEEISLENQKVRILYTTERGLSKSRNMALRNATADIVAIADDDLYYYDDFDKKILEYYERNKKADLVLFSMDSYLKVCSSVETKCKFWQLGTYISIQTSLNRNAIDQKGILFNEYFGTGSRIFNSGEENIFLADCYKRGLGIYYCPEKILRHELSESTWFRGYNDPKFISDRGAIYYAICPKLSFLYYIRFAITKRQKIKPISILRALKLMQQGRKLYKQILTKHIEKYEKEEF